MGKIKPRQRLLPPWEMPSDPVKAVGWFMHWLLKVVVRFFWLPIIVMVIFETYNSGTVAGIGSGLISGVVTLLVGVFVWGVLQGVLFLVNGWVGVSRVIADARQMQQMQQGMFNRYSSPFSSAESKGKIVEGSLSDVEEKQSQSQQE